MDLALPKPVKRYGDFVESRLNIDPCGYYYALLPYDGYYFSLRNGKETTNHL